MHRNILLVDDNKPDVALSTTIADLCKGREKVDIDTASSAEAALMMISRKDYHLVITDLNMPRISGQEFIMEVKTNVARSMPILVLTNSDYQVDIAGYRCRSIGRVSEADRHRTP